MKKNNHQPHMKLGQPSWRLASNKIEAFITRTGGMIGPVIFDRAGKKISPFSVAPWAEEKLPRQTPNILKALRGDFFCLPFGSNSTPYRGENYPLHGETANADWKFESLTSARGEHTLHLSLRTKTRPGRVDKTITLIDDQSAIYSRHVISEMSGPMNPGHHAMLKFPAEPGSGLISTSRFVYGQVFPDAFENPAEGGYSALKPGAKFSDLSKVPGLDGSVADLSKYPARLGFEDAAMIVADPKDPLAWTAVSFPAQRYVWFALKDPQVLASTMFWHSNRGRHYAPWSSRHIGVLGIEDITANFHKGIAGSVNANPISKAGYPTSIQLDPRHPLVVNYIMACAPAPAGFDAVKSITPDASGKSVVLLSRSGRSLKLALDVRFLFRPAGIQFTSAK